MNRFLTRNGSMRRYVDVYVRIHTYIHTYVHTYVCMLYVLTAHCICIVKEPTLGPVRAPLSTFHSCWYFPCSLRVSLASVLHFSFFSLFFSILSNGSQRVAEVILHTQYTHGRIARWRLGSCCCANGWYLVLGSIMNVWY